ncbi:hypothetical protein AGLY_016297 [Aphis glycines]|uniref:Uncharacterized protein n=1 Tax=Aphis glycines TaxID=307491 RepID=A0A6G0SYE6_APHGL|nr:hypothetical protein AGLY_016297 [Aphis glycines]
MRNDKLGISKICLIQSLSEFKHSSRYAGSIHSIGFDPFLSLVKKLQRTSLNLLSSNIFLYEIVASSDFGHIAVTQMISENHNIGNTTLVTYVRLDVAHMIKIFCRIKCLTGLKNKSLKEFYVRGFRLLLYSGDLSTFEIRLEAFLTVMISETDGWSGDTITQSEKSREYILNLIKGYTDNYIAREEYNEDENASDNMPISIPAMKT